MTYLYIFQKTNKTVKIHVTSANDTLLIHEAKTSAMSHTPKANKCEPNQREGIMDITWIHTGIQHLRNLRQRCNKSANRIHGEHGKHESIIEAGDSNMPRMGWMYGSARIEIGINRMQYH